MPKTYDETIWEKVYMLYVFQGMEPEPISEITEPSARRIREVIKERGWEKQRTIRLSSPGKVALEAMYMMAEIYRRAREEGRLIDSKESDILAKQNKIIENLDKNLSATASMIEGQGKFMSFISEKDEALYEQLIPLSIEFAEQLVNNLEGL